HVSRFQHFLRDLRSAAQLDLVAFHRAQVDADFEEAGAQTVLLKQSEHLFGVLWMRAIVESEGDRLGRKVRAEDFTRGATRRLSRLGGGIAELLQDLLAVQALAKEADVGFPFFARGSGAASGKLRKDSRDLFAVGELNGL